MALTQKRKNVKNRWNEMEKAYSYKIFGGLHNNK